MGNKIEELLSSELLAEEKQTLEFMERREREANEKILRSCLKCDRRFTAKGRHNRLCYLCLVGQKTILTTPDFTIGRKI